MFGPLKLDMRRETDFSFGAVLRSFTGQIKSFGHRAQDTLKDKQEMLFHSPLPTRCLPPGPPRPDLSGGLQEPRTRPTTPPPSGPSCTSSVWAVALMGWTLLGLVPGLYKLRLRRDTPAQLPWWVSCPLRV